MSERRDFIILAGGTGGHIFPGLAVARELLRRGASVSWLGAQGMEQSLVPTHGVDFDAITIHGLRGSGLTGWLAAPVAILRAVRQARAVLKRRSPCCVLSMGGYAAGPGGLAARWMGIPLLVHEQNSVPGITNRALARVAKQTFSAFPSSFPQRVKEICCGNPVREELRRLDPPRQRLAAHQGNLRLLVLGGSQGARRINECLPAALARMPGDERPQVLHQAGKRHVQGVREDYRALDIQARVEGFIDDMAASYAWADLAVCRAGALTLAELAAVGLGAILVPFPHAADDHQRVNAGHMERAGAARIIGDRDLTATALAQELGRLLAPGDAPLAMATAARSLDRGDATAILADACMEQRRCAA